MTKDTVSTAAVGGYGILMLQSVQWERTWPFSGETVKAIFGLLLLPIGYLMYREKSDATKSSGD